MNNFPLLKLPAVALHEVLKMMMPIEIFKLAMCSSDIESFLRCRKYKTNGLHMHLNNRFPRFDIKYSDGWQPIWFKSTTRVRYTRKNEEYMYLTHTNFDEMFDIQRKLCAIFHVPFMVWILYIDSLRCDQFSQLLHKVLETEFTQLRFRGGSLNESMLTEVLDEVPATKELEISSDIPLTFEHPNALQYFKTHFDDARWVKLENLFSIRNVDSVTLLRTNFDCSDLNKFLRYWVDCDEFILRRIDIGLKYGTVYDEDVITDQLTTASCYGNGYPEIFMKSRKDAGQKYVFGRLELHEEIVTFITCDPNEECSELFELSKILDTKRELEEELLNLRLESQRLKEEIVRAKSTMTI